MRTWRVLCGLALSMAWIGPMQQTTALAQQAAEIVVWIDNVASEVWFDGFDYHIKWEHEGKSGWILVPQRQVRFETVLTEVEYNADDILVPRLYAPNITPRIISGMKATLDQLGASTRRSYAAHADMLSKAAWAVGGGQAGELAIALQTAGALKNGRQALAYWWTHLR